MFFCHEILQRRQGSFGIIWLAAMQNKSLTRREYERVHIAKKCEEILEYIMARVRTSRDHTRRFSLYLSAQLMFGTVKVFYQQNMHLLTDCMEYEKKIKKSLVRELMALPESAPLSERRACLHEDFSSLSTNVLQDDPSNPLIRSTIDLLMESIDFLRDESENLSSDYGILPPHTAPQHSITLQDYSTELSANSHLYPIFSQVAPGQDLDPIPAEELEKFYIEAPQVSPIKHIPEIDPFNQRFPEEFAVNMPPQSDPTQIMPEDLPMEEVPPPQSESHLAAIQEILEQTPAVTPPEIEPSRPEKRANLSDSVEEEERDQNRKRQRISTTLVLPPLENDGRIPAGTGRRPAPLHLIIDEPRRLTKHQISEWMDQRQKICKAPSLPMFVEKVENLMTQPGCEGNFNSRPMKDFFKNLCTLTGATAVIPSNAEAETQRADATGVGRQGETPVTNVSSIVNRSGDLSAQQTPATGKNSSKASTMRKRASTTDQTLSAEGTYIVPPHSELGQGDGPVISDFPPPAVPEELLPSLEENQLPLAEELQQPLEDFPLPNAEDFLTAAPTDMAPLLPEEGQQTTSEVKALSLIPEDPFLYQPPQAPSNQSQNPDPSLIIEGPEDYGPTAAAPLTPKTMSIRDKLTRSLKKHMLTEDVVEFTGMTDLIKPGVTSRQEAAQLFHGLLTVTKRRHVVIKQDEPFGPIEIRKGPRFVR